MQTVRSSFIFNFKKKLILISFNYKNVLKIILILVLSIIILFSTETLFQNRNSVTNRKKAIMELPKNSVDILIVGNSHAYCSYNPTIMEETLPDKIINAGLPDEKIDVLYYNLKEVLKNQNPKIIVLEAFAFGRSNNEYSGYVANLDSLNFDLDKIRACFEIIPDKMQALNMCFRIYRCHNNWKNPKIVLGNVEDILGINSDNNTFGNGFYALKSKMSENTIKKYESSNNSKFKPVVDDYSIGYFKRIVNLCNERGIKLIVTMAPMNDIYLKKINNSYTEFYNKMSTLCQNEGVQYIDFNILYHKVGLTYDDFEDAFHDAQHTNYLGAEKISSYFAQILKETEF